MSIPGEELAVQAGNAVTFVNPTDGLRVVKEIPRGTAIGDYAVGSFKAPEDKNVLLLNEKSLMLKH